jgi:alkylated DNA repair dioxygenase AlkB
MYALVSPMDLFATPVVQLVDDAQGGIRYWPGFAGASLAADWFHALQAKATWAHLQRPMYDRVVDVPRLLATYRIDALPPGLPLADMLSRVKDHVPAPYSNVGLNLYRDGNDSVAMHGDKLHTLKTGHPITIVSLGESRRMLIRAKGGDRTTLAIELEPGSLLSMSHASQLTHEHGVPKTKAPHGPRISAVFRVRE